MPVVRISDKLFKEVQKWAEPLVDDFESTLWKIVDFANQAKKATTGEVERVQRKDPLIEQLEQLEIEQLEKALSPRRGRRPPSGAKVDLTPQKEFRVPILEALAELGGEAHAQEVIRHLEQKLEGRLKQGDYEPNRDRIPKWQKAVHFQRLLMVRERLLAKNTPRGVWRITDEGLQYLKQLSAQTPATDGN